MLSSESNAKNVYMSLVGKTHARGALLIASPGRVLFSAEPDPLLLRNVSVVAEIKRLQRWVR